MTTQLPAGAGPTAGAFSGAVYTPPTAATTTTGTTTTTTRPTILSVPAAADASGRMVAAFTAPPSIAWEVSRIVVQSSIRGQALVYVGTSIAPENLVSGTIAGDLDENDANQPYLVPEGQTMFVYWVAGGVCRARIEYTEI